MKLAVRFSKREEVKAVPILVRHSPGMILPGRIYVISPEAAQALRDEGIKFQEVSTEVNPPDLQGAKPGERI
jgi:hypothetical protein